MNKMILKKGREKALLRRHPWVFSGAIQSIQGEPKTGETIEIRDAHGGFLAWGAYSPSSQIRARIWSWKQDEEINPSYFEKRIHQANQLRDDWIDPTKTTAYRLIHAESDSLPGLVVDRYNNILVLQVLSAGIERWRDEIVKILSNLHGIDSIYERSDVTVRELEGLPERTGILFGELPRQPMIVRENGLQFLVDIATGQKTGFYLDQRDNRQFCREISNAKSVLNCFAFAGGFSVYALAGGAESVLSIDSSEEALHLAKENVLLNQGSLDQTEWIAGDVFEELRTLRDQGRQFDMVILDPPKFAPTASQAQKAARGYKDINLYGFKLLKPGGVLMTFSCSGGIDASFFQKIVADAALDAEVDAKILYRLSQAPDHPTHLAFPEGSYLKGLVITKGE
jgi:23S rRNA (cytosine1962-C5)-methyltransferase